MASDDSYSRAYKTRKSSSLLVYTKKVNGSQGETKMMASKKVITVNNTCSDGSGASQSHSSTKCNILKVGSTGEEVRQDTGASDGPSSQENNTHYHGAKYSSTAMKDSRTKDGQTEVRGARQTAQKERNIKIKILSGESGGDKFSSTMKKDVTSKTDSAEVCGARTAQTPSRNMNIVTESKREGDVNKVNQEQVQDDAANSEPKLKNDSDTGQLRNQKGEFFPSKDVSANLCVNGKPPVQKNRTARSKTRKGKSESQAKGESVWRNCNEMNGRKPSDTDTNSPTRARGKPSGNASWSTPGSQYRTDNKDTALSNGLSRGVKNKDKCSSSFGGSGNNPEAPHTGRSHEDVKIKDEFRLSYKSMNLTEVPPEVSKCLSAQELLLDHNLLDSLPGSLCVYLTELVRLSAVGNDIEYLPAAIGQLSELRELYLNENQLTSLPSTISHLSKLTHLNIVGNMIKALPAEFGELTALERLDADENLIENLPELFGDLSRLQVLEMSSNKLCSLPESFGKLKCLHTLNISSNKLEDLPASFGQLPQITSLDMSENFLKVLPTEFKSHGIIELFYFETNNIAVLPEWFGNMPNLLQLSMRDNKLPDAPLPEAFGQNSQNLKSLDMAGNFMTSLPDSLGMLTNLEHLHLGSVIGELERRDFQNGNWLERLPETFGCLTNLRHVRLDENQFVCLPENFGHLINLESLDLCQNRLRCLPDSFCQLRSLRHCQLSRNMLERLPDDFGQLSNLVDLRLDNNLISELPVSFAQLTQLGTLDLFNNRLTEVPDYIKSFTNLERLDLMENQVKLKLDDIPRIDFAPKYAPRNPAFKDNWRGRLRSDVDPDFKKKIKKVEWHSNDEDADGEVVQDSDERLMQQALQRSTSLWQSHDGPTKREVYRQPDTLPPSQPLEPLDSWEPFISSRASDTSEEPTSPSDPSRTTGVELPDGHQSSSSSTATWGQSSSLTSDGEDWDKDLESGARVHGTYLQEEAFTKNWPSERKVYKFVPSEIHPHRYHKSTLPKHVEEGQFDDADELD